MHEVSRLNRIVVENLDDVEPDLDPVIEDAIPLQDPDRGIVEGDQG